MAINFPCPHCGQTYKLNDNQVGTKGRCAKCQKVFVVSAPTPPQLAATASLPKPAAAPTPSPRRTDPAPRPDPLTSPIPRQLGRFEVRSKLGQGTFGAVYRAFDAILKREVAIKLPHAAALALEGVGERFLREAEAAAQLHHPNIVPVHDAGVCDGQLYIASAFIDGQTLQSAMRDQPLDHRRAARLIMKLADALAYAHDKGIVHRDVKPGNVMLDSHDEPYVMDFGLARWEQAGSQLTQDGSLLGTPAYMSPEQAGAPVGKVGPASDQYALGVMLYEMLVGRVPFSDSQLPVVLSKIRDEEAVSPRSLDGSIPLDLETICLKAMSKRPQDRYADGRALAADLRRWLDGEPIQARRLGVIERTVRWARKNKAVAGSLTAVAASLILVAVVSSISAARMAVLRDQEAKQRETADKLRTIAESREQEATAARDKEIEERVKAESLAYVSSIQAADAEWERNQVSRALHHLETCNDSMRGWEHSYLKSKFNSGHRVVDPQTGGVRCVLFSPVDDIVAIGHKYGTISICDANTGSRRYQLTDNSSLGSITSLAFSPDGRQLISGRSRRNGSDTCINIWDLTTRKLALGIGGQEGKNWAPFDVAFNRDGSRIASCGSDNFIRIWDSSNGEQLISIRNSARGIAFSPDQNRLASYGFSDGRVTIWDIITGKALQTFQCKTLLQPLAIAWSPDGKSLSAGGNDAITAWDVESNSVRFSAHGHSGPINAIAYSPDGSIIASGGEDTTVRTWDATDGTPRLVMRSHQSAVNSLAFRRDGLKLVSGAMEDTIRIWDVINGQEVPTIVLTEGTASSVAVSPKGDCFASLSGVENPAIWDARTNEKLITLTRHQSSSAQPGVLGGFNVGVAFSPDGQSLATGHSDKNIIIWNALTGSEIITLTGHESELRQVMYSPDGNSILSVGRKAVIIHDVRTGTPKVHFRGHSEGANRATFSNDGKRVISTGVKSLKIWDAMTGTEIKDLSDGLENGCGSIDISPNGQLIALSCTDYDWRDSIQIRDAFTGKELRSVSGKMDSVASIEFSPDGKRIATCGNDRVIRIWDVESAQEMIVLHGHKGGVGCLAFNPVTSDIISCGADSTIKKWSVISK